MKVQSNAHVTPHSGFVDNFRNPSVFEAHEETVVIHSVKDEDPCNVDFTESFVREEHSLLEVLVL